MTPSDYAKDRLNTAVTLARIEAKLDLINAAAAAAQSRADDHEARLRVIEARPVVTWRAVVSLIAACAAVVGAAAPFLAALYGS